MFNQEYGEVFFTEDNEAFGAIWKLKDDHYRVSTFENNQTTLRSRAECIAWLEIQVYKRT